MIMGMHDPGPFQTFYFLFGLWSGNKFNLNVYKKYHNTNVAIIVEIIGTGNMKCLLNYVILVIRK